MKSRRRSPSFIGCRYQAANHDQLTAGLPPEALNFKPPLLACCHLQRLRVQQHSCGIGPIRACLSVRVANGGLTCELCQLLNTPALRLWPHTSLTGCRSGLTSHVVCDAEPGHPWEDLPPLQNPQKCGSDSSRVRVGPSGPHRWGGMTCVLG